MRGFEQVARRRVEDVRIELSRAAEFAVPGRAPRSHPGT